MSAAGGKIKSASRELTHKQDAITSENAETICVGCVAHIVLVEEFKPGIALQGYRALDWSQGTGVGGKIATHPYPVVVVGLAVNGQGLGSKEAGYEHSH